MIKRTGIRLKRQMWSYEQFCELCELNNVSTEDIILTFFRTELELGFWLKIVELGVELYNENGVRTEVYRFKALARWVVKKGRLKDVSEKYESQVERSDKEFSQKRRIRTLSSLNKANEGKFEERLGRSGLFGEA